MPRSWLVFFDIYTVIIYAGVAAVIVGLILTIWSDYKVRKKEKK